MTTTNIRTLSPSSPKTFNRHASSWSLALCMLVTATSLMACDPTNIDQIDVNESESEDFRASPFDEGPQRPSEFETKVQGAGLDTYGAPLNNGPTYPRAVSNTMWGVSSVSPEKDATYYVNELEGQPGGKGFTINVEGKAGSTKAKVLLLWGDKLNASTCTDHDEQDGKCKTCTVGPAGSGVDCWAPYGTLVVRSLVKQMGNGYEFARIATDYHQKCDATVGRYCGSLQRYENTQIAFINESADIKLFDVDAGDQVVLYFTTNKEITGTNPPTLRIRGVKTGSNDESEIGQRHSCVREGSVGNDQRYKCEIPPGAGVPDLSDYEKQPSAPHAVLSSSRDGNGAIFKLWNVMKIEKPSCNTLETACESP